VVPAAAAHANPASAFAAASAAMPASVTGLDAYQRLHAQQQPVVVQTASVGDVDQNKDLLLTSSSPAALNETLFSVSKNKHRG